MALDKTEAVNLMLAAVGAQPVSSGEAASPTMPEVVKAVRILDKVDRDFQTQGWSFNTDEDVTLTPSGGEIALGSDIISVEPHNRSNRIAIRVVSGTQKLYDREESTHTFTGPLQVRTIKQLAFADMPMPARAFITSKATRMFAEMFLGEPQPALRQDEAEASAIFHDSEISTRDLRLSDSYHVGRTAGRISPADDYSG